MNRSKCNFYNNPDYIEYLIEYRGDFLGQISKVSYACGDIINNTLAIISVKEGMIEQLVKDIPSILFVDFRNIFILEDIQMGYSPESTSSITQIKNNPYLRLSGAGVLVGIVDTGIDYLNEEFIREDSTTRIEEIWDQTLTNDNEKNDVFIGNIYNSEKINKAIEAKKSGGNPYDIVPSKDDIGHGTQVASIVGARGYNRQLEGVAQDCNYVVVKLLESESYKKLISQNNLKQIPVYNVAEIIAGLEYLRKYALKVNKPMVILIPLGSTEYTHGGTSIMSRYINSLATFKGIVTVTGTGNEGATDGHTSGYINNKGDITSVELLVEKAQKFLAFRVYIKKPNKMIINVISPSGQESGFIPAKLQQKETVPYVLEDTNLKIQYYIPDNISGMQIIYLTFNNIKPGIWKLKLKGEYITDGRYDMWLPSSALIAQGTKFLNPDPYITLTEPSSAQKILSVSYYNQIENSIVAESGKGFPLNYYIKPNIAAPGINILTTTIGNKTKVMSGSSVAAAIVAGCCALLLQWGIVNGNDTTMFATTVIGYLVNGASRRLGDKYPNAEWGYGQLNFEGVFKSLSSIDSTRSYSEYRDVESNLEYYFNNIFIRIPQEMEEIINV